MTDLKDILNKRIGVEKVQYSVRTIVRPLQDFKMNYPTIQLQVLPRALSGKEAEVSELVPAEIDEKETFDDVIFTDESSIQLECHRRKCFRKIGCEENWRISTSTNPKFMCGWHIEARSHTAGDVLQYYECYKVWRHTVSFLSSFHPRELS